jgi:hypothetical protein
MANQWQYGIRKRRGVNNEESKGALEEAHIAYQNGGEISVGENENAKRNGEYRRKWRINNQPAYRSAKMAAWRLSGGEAAMSAKAQYRHHHNGNQRKAAAGEIYQ